MQLGLPLGQALVDAVQRVDNQNADASAHYQPTGFGQDGVYGIILIARKDVADVIREETHRLCVKLFRHADMRVETQTRKFLYQFAVVIDDGHVLGTEIGYLPLVPQAEADDQFVHPLRFPVTGTAAHYHQALQFERAIFVEVRPPRFGTARHAVLVERTQLLAHIIGGEHTFKGDFFGLRQADAETVSAIFD